MKPGDSSRYGPLIRETGSAGRSPGQRAQRWFRASLYAPLCFVPMLDIVSGINSSTALWYASRATGVVALLLLTAVMLLGLLVTRQGRLPGLPRFAVTGLHRNLSLLAVVFVAVHVLSAVARRVREHPAHRRGHPAGVVVRAVWLGLGAVSLDLMLAVIVTSLLRRHLSPQALAGGAPDRLRELAGRLGALASSRAATCGTGCCSCCAIACAIAVVGAARVAGVGRGQRRAARRAGRPADDRRARPRPAPARRDGATTPGTRDRTPAGDRRDRAPPRTPRPSVPRPAPPPPGGRGRPHDWHAHAARHGSAHRTATARAP